MNKQTSLSKGFSLVEMAVVLAILGLAVGGLFAPVSAQMEQKSINETKATITKVEQALLGYAMANGRFPCPAAAPGTGVTAVERFGTGGTASNGKCSVNFNGYVPAVTLGLSPTNSSGYILDGWNNPIRYAISDLTDDSGSTRIFTKSTGMKNANSSCTAPCSTGMTYIASQTLLYVCASGTGITSTTCGTATKLSDSAAFIVYSAGKNAATAGTGTDEAANPNPNSNNNDAVFVSHEPAATTNNVFDDILSWTSANNVFERLVQANQLP